MIIPDGKKTDLATVTSIGVRITPVSRQPVHSGGLFTMQATSAETNALNVSAALGLTTKALTKFVKDSEIALFIKSQLRMRNIGYEGLEVPQGSPWGYRHQFNIADSGFGVRGARVLNDRAGEVGCTLSADDFDLDRIFNKEGCRMLHLSGLAAALSPEATECCLHVARAAKRSGTVISFDLNYRKSFWVGRETELRRAFTEIASMADILIGNEEDFQLALGIEGPNSGESGVMDNAGAFKAMIERASVLLPNVSVFVSTLRQVVCADVNYWGALMLADGKWYYEEPREIHVLDRIGGGDGFVGGLLYGLLRGWDYEKSFKFGWATGALAVTVLDDYATPIDEEQVWSIYNGNARVKR